MPKNEIKVVDMPVIESIMEKSKYSKNDESDIEDKINKFALDEMIAHIDDLLSKQMDEILHNEEFQKLESVWRGLYFLVERTDFNENIKLSLLNVTKEEALEDLRINPVLLKVSFISIFILQNMDNLVESLWVLL